MIGIIGAMEAEVKLLRSWMEAPSAEKIGSFEFITGTLAGKEAALLQCGIGKVAAAAGCTAMLTRFKPSLVINTGSAGGMKKEQSVGDVVAASALLQCDVDVTAFGYEPGQLPGQNKTFPVKPKYIDLADEAVDALKAAKTLPASMKHLRGLIGTSDTFMHEEAALRKVSALFPEIAACDMEAAAIAHACALFNVDALVIRALSDIAGADSPVVFEEFLPIAAAHSAEIVREIVKRL